METALRSRLQNQRGTAQDRYVLVHVDQATPQQVGGQCPKPVFTSPLLGRADA